MPYTLLIASNLCMLVVHTCIGSQLVKNLSQLHTCLFMEVQFYEECPAER